MFLAVKTQSPSHWNTRKFPYLFILWTLFHKTFRWGPTDQFFLFFFLLWINFLATSLRTLNLALVPKDLLPFSSKGFIALHFTSNLPILHSLNHYHSINHYIIIIKLNQAHWTLFSKTIQLIVNCSTNSSFVFPFKF